MLDKREELGALCLIRLLEHLDERQGDFAFAQVVIRGLARVGCGDVVQNVVTNLEGDAYGFAKTSHCRYISR